MWDLGDAATGPSRSCNPSPESPGRGACEAGERLGSVRTHAPGADMPPNNTISRGHQVLPASCHVTLLTFHVMVFVKCSPFSISQPCSLYSPIRLCASRGLGEPAAGLAHEATEHGVRAQEWQSGFKPVIRHNLFHMLLMKPSRAAISLLYFSFVYV